MRNLAITLSSYTFLMLSCLGQVGVAPTRTFRAEAITCSINATTPYTSYICTYDGFGSREKSVDAIRILARSILPKLYSLLIVSAKMRNVEETNKNENFAVLSKHWLIAREKIQLDQYIASVIRIGEREWVRMRSDQGVVSRDVIYLDKSKKHINFEPVYLSGTVYPPYRLDSGSFGVMYVKVSSINQEECSQAGRYVIDTVPNWSGYIFCKTVPQFFSSPNFYFVYPFLTQDELGISDESNLEESILCSPRAGLLRCLPILDRPE